MLFFAFQDLLPSPAGAWVTLLLLREPADRVKKVHDFLTVGAAAPLQEAAVVVGLKFGDDYYKWLQDKYTHMRKLFLDGLDRIGIQHNVPQGAYYVMVDVSEFGYESDLRLCEALAEHVGVGAVPGSSFFREPENRYIQTALRKAGCDAQRRTGAFTGYPQEAPRRHKITGQAMDQPRF